MKRNDEFARFWEQEEKVDKVCKSVCPMWWHFMSQEAINGRVETFCCKEHYCTDLLVIQPYADDQLKAALADRCKRANSQGEWPCSVFESRGDSGE